MDRQTELRDRALAMANDSEKSPERVVERAEVYLAFLKGETGPAAPGAPEPLPIDPAGDGYPDALHG